MRYGDSQQLGRSVGGISIVDMRWADINKINKITRGPGGLAKDMVFREAGRKGLQKRSRENPGKPRVSNTPSEGRGPESP